eukprot:3945810-Lingulodinium_polyedra.AAC.1
MPLQMWTPRLDSVCVSSTLVVLPTLRQPRGPTSCPEWSLLWSIQLRPLPATLRVHLPGPLARTTGRDD